ncbi:MAG: iron-containing alcohol dehydrogenase [Proteobacteria bacterium]|nr:iron-containing alcohol dehydrogenase [Desulfobacula sp.]MBU3953743.1 iron-containing alcohol dehydrogenase [Pseudomonadota bacterium]MBU4133147.1 iron-containing alcohol dehydrogenase [Pseudomonadota bacterium]
MPVSIETLRKFVAPEIIFGNGSRHLAGEYCKKFYIENPMIVTDKGVMDAGWTDQVARTLIERNIDPVIFSQVTPNPRADEVMMGAKIYNQAKCDAIIAVGGGSPMDCAKGIGIVVSSSGHILDYEGVDRISAPLPPMIFIPTTAGTSADVSQFCIINDTKRLVKIAIISKIVIPDIALIDPETTTSMDPYLTACTGMDALAHAVEAFASTAASKITDVHALEAIRLLTTHLPRIGNRPHDLALRENIMLASMQAGLAFSNAVLGAVHAMAHSLGGLLDLPHGECNSLLLEHVINFNYSAAPERFKVIAQNLGLDTRGWGQRETKNALFDKIRSLRYQLGISKSLGQVRVTQQDIPDLSEKALNDACLLTNPRKTNKRDIETIYEEAL